MTTIMMTVISSPNTGADLLGCRYRVRRGYCLAPRSRQVEYFCSTLAITSSDYLPQSLFMHVKAKWPPLRGRPWYWKQKTVSGSRRRAQTARRSDPALQLAPHDGLDDLHARWTVIEARDMAEILTAVFLEQISACFTSDFLKCFKTIGDKTGIHDRDIRFTPSFASCSRRSCRCRAAAIPPDRNATGTSTRSACRHGPTEHVHA
jgi:hypothetical protein